MFDYVSMFLSMLFINIFADTESESYFHSINTNFKFRLEKLEHFG